MELLAVVEQGARAYPALLPLVLVSIALTLWACENRRWLWATVTGILGCAACVLYIGSPAGAADRVGEAGMHAAVGQAHPVEGNARDDPGPRDRERSGDTTRALLEPGRFASTVRLHPRFPRDFPIPRSFRLESDRSLPFHRRGGQRGVRSARTRKGEGLDRRNSRPASPGLSQGRAGGGGLVQLPGPLGRSGHPRRPVSRS